MKCPHDESGNGRQPVHRSMTCSVSRAGLLGRIRACSFLFCSKRIQFTQM